MVNMPEGTVSFWMRRARPGWTTDPLPYDFGSFTGAGVTISARKNADRTIGISVNGLDQGAVHFTEPLPQGATELFVAVTWQGGLVTLYFNAVVVATRPFGTQPL